MTIDLQAVLRPAHRFGAVFTVGLYGIAILAVCTVGAVVFAPKATGDALVGIAGFTTEGVSVAQAIVLVLLLLVQAGLWAGIFSAGRTLCLRLKREAVGGAAQAADRLSLWLWLLLLWSVLGQAAGSAAVTWHLADGERMVAIGLGTAQVSVALAALMAAFLARAFSLGAELWQDHREIV